MLLYYNSCLLDLVVHPFVLLPFHLELEHNNNPEYVVWCKYDLKQVQSMKISNNNSCLSLFHINTCSLIKKIEDLELLHQIN